MTKLHLTVSGSVVGGRSKRTTTLRQDGKSRNIDIFYEFDRIVPFSDDTLLDGHVLAVLLYASSCGKPLVVHGALSRAVMRHINELLLSWRIWKPDVYKVIEVMPLSISDRRMSAVDGKAISAFSGGVDATFTALRHAKFLSENVRYPLSDVLMVHGFDVELHNQVDFDQLTKRVSPLISKLDLGLRVVRTNSRDLKLQNWEDSFALELAACLHMLSEEFQYGLIGSSEPYNALVLPWGSSPVTDHLMSGNIFSIIHDGAGFSRTDKVAVINQHEIACETLKVCYAGMDQSSNCGRCEKCVRTQLNFMAAGVKKVPKCFPNPLNLDLINTIQISNEAQLAELVSIVGHADAHQVSGVWLDILRARIGVWKPVDQSVLDKQRNGSFLKRSAVKLVTLVGLDAHLKKSFRSTRRSMLKNLENKI